MTDEDRRCKKVQDSYRRLAREICALAFKDIKKYEEQKNTRKNDLCRRTTYSKIRIFKCETLFEIRLVRRFENTYFRGFLKNDRQTDLRRKELQWTEL